jgi:hypothetical protein
VKIGDDGQSHLISINQIRYSRAREVLRGGNARRLWREEISGEVL